jgi:glycosyltransferase involved in cell wall biosynthesis
MFVKSMEITVVLPAYNEAVTIEKCVNFVKKILAKKSYEIIIAEDGSSDGTREIAQKIAKRDKKIRLISSRKKLGRGLALKNAFKIAKGDVFCYIDADIATDMEYLPKLLKYVKDYDVVLGSRYLPDSVVERPFLRSLFSKSYNFFVRYIIGCRISDTQIGFKAFSKEFVQKEIMKINEKTWAWDTIVVVDACKKGYRIKEFPVKWKETRNKRTPLLRLLRDMKIHGRVLCKLFLKWNLGFDIEL